MSNRLAKTLGRVGALVLTLAILCSVESPAFGQVPGDNARNGQLVVINALAGDPACDAGDAQSLRVADLARDGKRLLQKCVAVAGTFKNRMLFGSLYDAQTYSAPNDIAHASERLGVYMSEELRKTFPADMSHVALIGNIGDCDELRHRDKVVMVSGYCHYSNGTYIAVASFNLTSPVDVAR